MADRQWQSTEVVAWTEREGPGRPPRGAAGWMWTTTAATLGVVFSVILFTDTLCPEHRAWVQTLAVLAFAGSLVAIVGLVRGWAVAPLVTVAAAGLGAVIGLIDTVHAPVRGGVIAAGFGLAMLLAGWLALRQLPVRAWDHQVQRSVAPDAMTMPAPRGRAAAAPAAAAPAAPARETDAEVHAPR